MEFIRPFLNFNSSLQLLRVIAVIALVGVAAAIATPRGRLPLALRGILRTLGKPVPDAKDMTVPTWKRLVAVLLVLVAVALAVV